MFANRSFLILAVLAVVSQSFAHKPAGYDPARPKELLAAEKPRELEGVGITQKVGEKIDPNLKFKNESGAEVRLGDYLHRNKPLLLSLVYYSCPSLCNLHLNGLNDVFKQMNWTPGKEFEVLSVSIDSKETPALALDKKNNYLKDLGKPEAAEGWHFLTGEEPQIQSLAEKVGFKYHWDEAGKQWAHASAAIVVTPDGTIARYLHGVMFEPQTVRLALTEAGKGKVGSVVDTILLFCFQFDPAQNKYVFYAFNIMRAGGALVALGLAAFMISFWISTRRKLGEGLK